MNRFLRHRPSAPAASLFRSKWPWLVLFIGFFSLYYALHGRQITPDPDSPLRYYLLTGDEPHYLLLAHSIAFDGDVDLYNNLKQRHFEAFYDRHVTGYVKNRAFWEPRVRGRLRKADQAYWDRRRYSTCPVGMPVLIAPAYRLGYLWGGRIRYVVVIFLHLLAAGLAVLTIHLTWLVTRNRAASLFVVPAFFISAPLLYYTAAIYPDLPGACALTICVWLLALHERRGPNRGSPVGLPLGLGTAMGCLPWLHAKYWPHVAVVAAFALFEMMRVDSRRRRALLFMLTPMLVLWSALAGYYWLIYGVPFPVSTDPSCLLSKGLRSGWLGLWFDGHHGLFAYTPLALLAFPGFFVLWNKGQRAGRLAVVLMLLHWILTGGFAEWHGGLSPSLRYWVSVMPLVALGAAAAFACLKSRRIRVTAAILAAVSIGVGVYSQGRWSGKLLYSNWHPVWPYFPWLRYDRALFFFPEAEGTDLAAAAVLLSGLAAWSWFVAGRKTEPGARRCKRDINRAAA